MDKISFKGLKNPSTCTIIDKKANAIRSRLTLELTDDGSQDLTDFQEILRKYKSPIADDARIRIDKMTHALYPRANDPWFMINGQRVVISENNMPVIAKFEALLNRICEKTKNSKVLSTDADYISSETKYYTDYALPPPLINSAIQDDPMLRNPTKIEELALLMRDDWHGLMKGYFAKTKLDTSA